MGGKGEGVFCEGKERAIERVGCFVRETEIIKNQETHRQTCGPWASGMSEWSAHQVFLGCAHAHLNDVSMRAF